MYHLDGNHGSDYPRNEEFVECGVPYISANCIVHNDVNVKLAKHLTEERASKLRKGIAQNGDVLFAHNATVGPVAILYTDDEKVILGTSLTCLLYTSLVVFAKPTVWLYNRLMPNQSIASMPPDSWSTPLSSKSIIHR